MIGSYLGDKQYIKTSDTKKVGLRPLNIRTMVPKSGKILAENREHTQTGSLEKGLIKGTIYTDMSEQSSGKPKNDGTINQSWRRSYPFCP